MVAVPSPRSSRNASAGIAYLTEGQAHDKSEKPRAWFVDGIDCTPETAAQEWGEVRQRHGKDEQRQRLDAGGQPMVREDGTLQMEGANVQALHVVLSYDPTEYDPNDLDAIEKAHRESKDAAEQLAVGHQAVVATQTDGKSGHVHTHIYFNAVHPETGRSMNFDHPAKKIEKLREVVNENAARHRDGFDNAKLMESRHSQRLSARELEAREQGKYVSKDDLFERLNKAAEQATSRDEFVEAADQQGVSFRFHGKGTSAAFIDDEGQEHKFRGRSMGSKWQAAGIEKQLGANRERVAEQQREAAELEQVGQRQRAEMELAEDEWDFEVEMTGIRTQEERQIDVREEEPSRGNAGSGERDQRDEGRAAESAGRDEGVGREEEPDDKLAAVRDQVRADRGRREEAGRNRADAERIRDESRREAAEERARGADEGGRSADEGREIGD